MNIEKTKYRFMKFDDTENMKQENKKQSWKPLFHLIRSVKLPWWLIIICIAITLGQSYLTLLFPAYTEQIYAGNFSSQIAITAVLVVLGQAICTAVFQFIGGCTSFMNRMRFQQFVWKKISRLPVSFYEKNEPKELITRTTEDTMRISEFLAYNIAYTISSIVTFVGSFVLIFGYDFRLALSQVLIIPLSYLIAIISGRIFFKFSNRTQGKLAGMSKYFAAVLPYVTLVKLFGQENKEEQKGYEWIQKYFNISMDAALVNTALSFAKTIMTVVKELTIILLGVWLVRDGSIEIAAWIAFYMYANTLYNGFQMIMAQWTGLKNIQGSCARISDVTSVPEEENPGTLDAKDVNKTIEFQNVTFGYEENNVLNNVSFTAKEGEITAIVGPSGAGKSTVLALLERFYQPKEGEILLGGHPSSELELHSWRKEIGYIPQSTTLISGTIQDNILYGCEDTVTKEKMIQAAKDADAYDFIMELEHGFDTEVGELGSKLSGGQRQRIAIARALIRDSKVLILDEATSDLDAQADAFVEQTIQNLAKTHTIIMVAHRLASVESANQIIVMENTKVVGMGTHEELMKSNEIYHHLVGLQTTQTAAKGGM